MIKRISSFIKIFGEKFSAFLKADGWFFFLLIILNLPIFFQWLIYLNVVELKYILIVAIVRFYAGAAVILFFCVALYFLLAKFPREKLFLQLLILIFCAVFFVIDTFLLYKFNVPLQSHLIQIVINTNLNETKEFLQTYVLEPKVLCGAAAFIFLTAAAVKKFRALFQNLSEQNLRRISYPSLIIFTPAALISVSWVIGAVIELAKLSLNQTVLGRDIGNIYAAVETVGDEEEILAEMDAQDEKIISNGAEIPYVIFVLGEAVSRNHRNRAAGSPLL